MLAAWFRMKYPHVAIGALASSASILQFMDLVSPDIFNSIISQDFRSESENCYKVLKGSWKLIEHTTNKPGGLELLQKSFRICKSNDFGAGSLEGWLRTAWVYTAMTDYPTPSNFLNPLPAYPIKKMTIDEVKHTAQQQMNRALKDHARLYSLSCSIMYVSHRIKSR
ncbi:uncharacterized protein HKW66_Vig0117140 [Vigna angularis]|uniref:Uncharacterized protein n=2 Tax=Phaseolus angularis TaxID=3914 RepID=A0A8T0JZA6_PHAAN|nr:uncharacterized protein HKW66_Vig0117140 [Vigna angularis]